MHFKHLNPKDGLVALRERVRQFVDQACIPLESNDLSHDVAALDRVLASLRPQAQAAGLYLPQLPPSLGGLGLSWVERAVVLEEAGRSFLAPGAMNCAPPDQPNMISLMRHGTPGQKERYLLPLAQGKVRSCFAMTEPAPGAGSDPSMLATLDRAAWANTKPASARLAIRTIEAPNSMVKRARILPSARTLTSGPTPAACVPDAVKETTSEVPPARLTDWRGKEWTPGCGRPAAHPSAAPAGSGSPR